MGGIPRTRRGSETRFLRARCTIEPLPARVATVGRQNTPIQKRPAARLNVACYCKQENRTGLSCQPAYLTASVRAADGKKSSHVEASCVISSISPTQPFGTFAESSVGLYATEIRRFPIFFNSTISSYLTSLPASTRSK